MILIIGTPDGFSIACARWWSPLRGATTIRCATSMCHSTSGAVANLLEAIEEEEDLEEYVATFTCPN
jgi:LSD1 subclass zinc finger protein